MNDDLCGGAGVTVLKMWAPRANRMRVQTGMPGHRPTVRELTRTGDGWWAAEVGDVETDTEYGFLIDDDDQTLVPGPRSRRLPHGVHGASQVYDSYAYQWHDTYWTGRNLAGAVIYEMHIGTFTEEGTFDAAIDRLDHLAGLGITHVEVLPINAFNGDHNWGYDGVAWFAVQESYGGPDGFKTFVDECHARGLAVVLDVVYNHFGPSGNYLPKFGPYLKEGRSTWGDLVNLDGPGSEEVRRYIIDNALMWFEEFHVDALRLDAVHALVDESKPHLLAELAAEVDALCAHLGRPLWLIAESDLNDVAMIQARSAGGYGMDAQWSDDFHHQVHALLTGERQGYYADFGTLPGLAKVLESGFFHDGTYSEFRRREHGKPVDRVVTPGYRFVVCLQNHDQVGNRAVGDRLSTLLSPGLLRVAALLLLTSPFTPMLWMGEEWGARTPWQFFTSHPEEELGRLTSEGRKQEFAEHGWSEEAPDPQDPETFRRSKLDWSELEGEENADILRLYRNLITLRRREANLTDPRLDRVEVEYDEDARWIRIHRGDLRVVVNLAGSAQRIPLDQPVVNVLLSTARGFSFDSTGLALPAESGAVISTTQGIDSLAPRPRG